MTTVTKTALGDLLVVDVLEAFALGPSTCEERCCVLHYLKDLLTFEDALKSCFHAQFPY